MTLRYLVIAEPLFSSDGIKDANAIIVEVLFGYEGDFVRVRAPGHGERAALSLEQGLRFLEAMDRLQPEALPDVTDPLPGELDDMDGWVQHCRIQREDGTRHTFSVANVYLSRECAARQRAFISQVFGTVREAIRLPETARLMEMLLVRLHEREPAASG